MRCAKILIVLITLSILAVSLISAVPLPRVGERDTTSLTQRSDIAARVRPAGIPLEGPLRIEGLPDNPRMNRAAAEAHEPLNFAGIISAEGNHILRWPRPDEVEYMRSAAAYLRAMSQRYPNVRITHWPDYIRDLFMAGQLGQVTF